MIEPDNPPANTEPTPPASPPLADAQGAPPPRAGLFAVLAAPWIAIVSPARAGQIIARANILLLLGVYLLLVLLTMGFTFACLTATDMIELDGHVLWDWKPDVIDGVETPRTLGAALRQRSAADVWRTWAIKRGVVWYIFESIIIGAITAAVFVVVLPLVILSRIYDAGAVWRTLGVAFRVPAAAAGPAFAIMLPILAIYVGGHDLVDYRRASDWVTFGEAQFGWWAWESLIELTSPMLWMLAIWCVVAAAQRAGRAAVAVAVTPAPEPGLRCIGCGYSLEHLPEGGRCPECGEPTEQSQSPETRPGLAWQTRGGWVVSDWCRTALAVLVRPRRAYRVIKTRPIRRRAGRFERIQLVLFFVATLLSILLQMFISEFKSSWNSENSLRNKNLFEFVFDTLFAAQLVNWWEWFIDNGLPMMLVATICCMAVFLVHRVIAAIVTLIAGAKADPADARALAGASGYESVFGWWFLFFNWTFSLGIVLGLDQWLVRLAEWMERESPWSFSSTVLSAVLLGGNVVLILAWFRRYRMAYVALRWANY